MRQRGYTAMKARGFSRGVALVNNLPKRLRGELMAVLGCNNPVYYGTFAKRKNINEAEYRAVKAVFSKYGLTDDNDIFDQMLN